MAVRSGTAGEDYACGMIEARGGQILWDMPKQLIACTKKIYLSTTKKGLTS